MKPGLLLFTTACASAYSLAEYHASLSSTKVSSPRPELVADYLTSLSPAVEASDAATIEAVPIHTGLVETPEASAVPIHGAGVVPELSGLVGARLSGGGYVQSPKVRVVGRDSDSSPSVGPRVSSKTLTLVKDVLARTQGAVERAATGERAKEEALDRNDKLEALVAGSLCAAVAGGLAAPALSPLLGWACFANGFLNSKKDVAVLTRSAGRSALGLVGAASTAIVDRLRDGRAEKWTTTLRKLVSRPREAPKQPTKADVVPPLSGFVRAQMSSSGYVQPPKQVEDDDAAPAPTEGARHGTTNSALYAKPRG